MNSVPSRPKLHLLALMATTLLAAALATGCVKKAATTDALDDNASGENGGGGTQTYITQNLPSSYSIAIPKSLIKNSGGTPAGRMSRRMSARKSALTKLRVRSAARSNALEEDIDPSTQAQGYWELTGLVEMMQSRKKEISQKFFLTDQIFEQVQANCEGVADDECVIPEGTLTAQYTEPMVNAMIDSLGGIENLWPGDLEWFQALIGTEIFVPEVRYQNLNGAGGYDHALSIVEYGLPVKLSWNTAKSKISTYFEYGDPSWGTGNDTFSYDLTQGVMVYRTGYSDSGYETTQTATFQADPAKTALHGVKFSVNSKVTGGKTTSQINIQGLADDLGGFAESSWLWKEDVLYLSAGEGFIQTGVQYALVSKTNGCSGLQADTQLGYVVNNDGIISVVQWGTDAPDTLQVCSFETDENNDYINQTEIEGVTVSGGGVFTDNYYYSETWDANGTLLKAGIRTSEEEDYSYYIAEEEASDYSGYEDQYDTESDSGEFIEVTQVTVSGLDGLLADYPEVIIVPDGAVPAVDDYGDVLGVGYYYWDTQQYEYSCWGSADQIATADVYLKTWDEELGDYVVTKVPGAAVSALQ